MGVNPADYKAVTTTNPADQIEPQNVVRINTPVVKDASRRAALDQDVVDDKFATDVIGEPAKIFRSVAGKKFDIEYEVRSVSSLIGLRAEQSLTDQETARLDRHIGALSQKTGINENYIRAELADYEAAMKQHRLAVYNQENSTFQHTTSDVRMDKEAFERLNQDIAGLLTKRVLTGGLSPEEKGLLDTKLKTYKVATNSTDNLVTNKVRDFENDVLETPTRFISRLFNDGLNNLIRAPGAYVPSNAPEKNIAIMQLEKTENFLGMKKPFPGNPNQAEMVTGTHEFVHSKQISKDIQPDGSVAIKYHIKIPPGASEDVKALIAETLADVEGPIAFFNQAHNDGEKWAMPQKEWWLQMRDINSFKIDPLYGEDGATHDSATYIRLYEQGYHLDMNKFYAEKQDLLKKIDERMAFGGRSSTEMTMAAVQDLLKEDAANPEKKLLSSMQKAEIQNFLESTKAQGYEPSPNYPKPQAADAPKPQAAISAPAWAQTPAA